MERLPYATHMQASRRTRPMKVPGERGLYGHVEAGQGRTVAMRTNDARSPLDESTSPWCGRFPVSDPARRNHVDFEGSPYWFRRERRERGLEPVGAARVGWPGSAPRYA